MAQRKKTTGMTTADFRRIALSLEGAEEGSHMGAVDFRVGGRIFATLAHAAQGYGNLMLTPEEQAPFVEEMPDVFVPVAGGWGRMGATHIVLAMANEDLVRARCRRRGDCAWRRTSGRRGVEPEQPAIQSHQLAAEPPARGADSGRKSSALVGQIAGGNGHNICAQILQGTASRIQRATKK
jgi:hypothetical protein